MPIDHVPVASMQRSAIIRQLASPNAAPQPGDQPLPPLESAEPALGAAAEKHNGVSGWAKLLYGAGTGADIASTIYNMKHGSDEANPMINFAGKKAAIPLMMGQELGSYLIAKKLLGDRHPKLMNALVGGAGLAHGAAAMHNLALRSPSRGAVDSIPPVTPSETIVYDTGNGGFVPPKK